MSLGSFDSVDYTCVFTKCLDVKTTGSGVNLPPRMDAALASGIYSKGRSELFAVPYGRAIYRCQSVF